jgi:hypothetical protein
MAYVLSLVLGTIMEPHAMLAAEHPVSVLEPTNARVVANSAVEFVAMTASSAQPAVALHQDRTVAQMIDAHIDTSPTNPLWEFRQYHSASIMSRTPFSEHCFEAT